MRWTNRRITDWSFPGRGLIRGEALARFVREHTGGTHDRADARCRWASSPPTWTAAQPILFQRGDPGVAVRASSAVPAVFQPVRIGAREYVDGGLVSPVPVRFARQMGAELVIAVDISAAPEGNATGDAMRMLLQTFAIMGRSINSFELRDADVVLRPRLAGVSERRLRGAQALDPGRARGGAGGAGRAARASSRPRRTDALESATAKKKRPGGATGPRRYLEVPRRQPFRETTSKACGHLVDRVAPR